MKRTVAAIMAAAAAVSGAAVVADDGHSDERDERLTSSLSRSNDPPQSDLPNRRELHGDQAGWKGDGYHGPGKGGKSGGYDDDDHPEWDPPGPWGPPAWGGRPDEDDDYYYGGKGGKSGSKGGKSGGYDDYEPTHWGHPYGGWNGYGCKCPDDDDYSYSGKSGKTKGRTLDAIAPDVDVSNARAVVAEDSGRELWGSPGWEYGHGGWSGGCRCPSSGWWGDSSESSHSLYHGHWIPKPYYGKSVKAKGGKAKGGKFGSYGSKGGKSSSYGGGYFVWVGGYPEPEEKVPDSSSPGICAPAFYFGGLLCHDGPYSYCSDPGPHNVAECGYGEFCYDKNLCFGDHGGAWGRDDDGSSGNGDHGGAWGGGDDGSSGSGDHGSAWGGDGHRPVGICDSDGKGLDCGDITAHCSIPGMSAECGAGRTCHDAGYCYGDGHPGVCGQGVFDDGHSVLDCNDVTTYCGNPGGYGQCANGAKCYDASLCHDHGHVGFCADDGDAGWADDGYDWDKRSCDDEVDTWCDSPGSPGQCPQGQSCFSSAMCDESETAPPVPAPASPVSAPKTNAPTHAYLHEICFVKGEAVDCSTLGGLGDGVYVDFTYAVETDSNKPLKESSIPLENAMLDAVAYTIEEAGEGDKYKDFTGMISAEPTDVVSDDEACNGPNIDDGYPCTVVKGETTFYAAEGSLDDDGHGDAGYTIAAASAICEAAGLIEESMGGHDFSYVEGIKSAEYISSEACNLPSKVVAAPIAVVKERGLGDSAILALAAAALALAVLALLAYRRMRRRTREFVEDDFSLISNSLNGSLPDGGGPLASTIDVHQCSSIYCDICNKGNPETRFLPVPRNPDLQKTMSEVGICPVAPPSRAFSDVTQKASNVVVAPIMPFGDEYDGEPAHDAVMRQPYGCHNDNLDTVDEVPNDSEIDTETESVYEDDDLPDDETVPPPPPPLSMHPTYDLRSADEISI